MANRRRAGIVECKCGGHAVFLKMCGGHSVVYCSKQQQKYVANLCGMRVEGATPDEAVAKWNAIQNSEGSGAGEHISQHAK